MSSEIKVSKHQHLKTTNCFPATRNHNFQEFTYFKSNPAHVLLFRTYQITELIRPPKLFSITINTKFVHNFSHCSD